MEKLHLLIWIVIGCLWGCVGEQNQQPKQEGKGIDSTPAASILSYIGNDFRIDEQHSYIGFKIKYFGFSPVRGRFDSFEGTVFYDPKSPASLRVNVVIPVNTIHTGNETRDKDLLTGEDWFNAKAFPNMTFISTRAAIDGAGGLVVTGDFTLNGITKSVQINMSEPTAISRDWAGNEQIDYSGRLQINRKDFGVKGGDFWDTVMENGLTQLSTEVEIELDIHTRRPDYRQRFKDLEPQDLRKQVLENIRSEGIEAGLAALMQAKNNNNPDVSAGAMITIGNILVAWERTADATRLFTLAMEWYPESTALINHLAVSHLLEKNQESAKEWFSKTLAMAPDDTRARAYLALLEDLPQ